MSLVLPSEFEAPGALRTLPFAASCGPVSAWQVLHYFGRDAAPEEIIRACRFDPGVGTYAIGIAVALAEFGLRVEFSTDPDPAPNPVERELYQQASELGVTVTPGLSLSELSSRLDGASVAVILYEEAETPEGHFSPILNIGEERVDVPNADTSFSLSELDARRRSPGLFRQCVIASATRAT